LITLICLYVCRQNWSRASKLLSMLRMRRSWMAPRSLRRCHSLPAYEFKGGINWWIYSLVPNPIWLTSRDCNSFMLERSISKTFSRKVGSSRPTLLFDLLTYSRSSRTVTWFSEWSGTLWAILRGNYCSGISPGTALFAFGNSTCSFHLGLRTQRHCNLPFQGRSSGTECQRTCKSPIQRP
jgi:hypothetical protein